MNFHIRAFISNRSPELIKLSALSQEEALNKVESQGYTVLSIREHRSGLNRVSRFPIMLFIQELSTLFDSGLSITEALSTLIEKEVDSYIQLVLRDVLSAIENGRQLSDAFALQSSVFSPLFIATVKACETSGNLSEGLKRYALYLEQVDLLRKKIISASIYPSIVLGFGVLVLLFLFTYVVPKFSQIYESRVNELSFSAEILLAIGSFVQLHPYLILIIAVLSGGFVVGLAY
jgi:general secretion pathway protein F